MPVGGIESRNVTSSDELIRWDLEKDTGTVEPHLSANQQSMGCSAFGKTLLLLAYYQAEENFETKDSFMPPVDWFMGTSNQRIP